MALCIVLVALAWYAVSKLPNIKNPGPSTNTQTTIPLSGSSYVEHTQYYDIAANYPATTPLTGTANAAALAQIKQFISDTVVEFKSEGNFATTGPAPEGKETLDIKYLIASSPHTASYIFTIYEDTLGAHGNTFFRTFTFSSRTGALLALKDLFSTPSYLDSLSSMSRARLPAVIGEPFDSSFIDNGTTPDDKSFSNFFFDTTDFVVLFAPYQVAPYAAGPQTLRIPVTDLGSILNSQYP